MTQLRLGGHLKSSDGLRHLVMNTRALDYNVVQTMVGGERDYTPHEIRAADIAELKKMLYGVELFVHLPYVLNPCEEDPRRRAMYRRTFKAFCETASNLGARAVVLHPGFKKELSEKHALRNLAKFLEDNVEDWNLKILLETDAGSKNGSAIGSLENLHEVIDALDMGEVAMCLDTTHLYARGVDLWKKSVRDRVLNDYGHMIKLVHLNSPDPKVTLGSHLDRHSTPFEDRPEWDHKSLFEAFAHFPLILERRSLAVQEQDAKFIRSLLGDEGATRGRYARTDARAAERRKQ